ncbi:hypothetical protein DESC_350085 [Desulfosarcina cetonica]|nr:hypothetical protein DESC_350085 [Desulfosarcina cetonica]
MLESRVFRSGHPVFGLDKVMAKSPLTAAMNEDKQYKGSGNVKSWKQSPPLRKSSKRSKRPVERFSSCVFSAANAIRYARGTGFGSSACAR